MLNPANPTDPEFCRLHELPRHVEAEVVALDAGSRDDALRVRLMELGFLPGEPVRVIAHGFPGQDPLAVRVGESTFALRRHEAGLVRVRRGGVE